MSVCPEHHLADFPLSHCLAANQSIGFTSVMIANFSHVFTALFTAVVRSEKCCSLMKTSDDTFFSLQAFQTLNRDLKRQ